jgi:hypothetical protein
MSTVLRTLTLLAFTLPAPAAPEAFEIGPDRLADLPRGKEADGIIGDFVMRSDTVEVTISGNLPERRANMSTFYGADGVTPGCLYDLGPRGAGNDQLTIFTPGNQRGPVTWVRITKDGKDGEAEIETVTTAANNKGLYKRHAYRLRDGQSGVEVETTLRNESAAALTVPADDKITNFPSNGSDGPYFWTASVDPRDKAGYAIQPIRGDAKLAPGEEKEWTRFLAVATSPAVALGLLREKAGGAGRVSLTLKDPDGKPVTTATVVVVNGGKEAPAWPDKDGKVVFAVAPGAPELRITDHGRAPVKFTLPVAAGQTAEREVSLGAPAAVVFKITEAGSGVSLPCKVQFIAKEGTAKADLGPPNRAHGCVDQWHSETGSFTVPLNPGSYHIVVTRGPEYSRLSQDIILAAAQRVEVKGALQRQVDTTGWVSTDFHNHSTPSGDNTCGTDDRVINLAAEHIEFAPTTEHNRLYDWAPHIQKLGLTAFVSTVTGMELTGNNQHLNCFPLTPEPGKQNNGAPVWNFDPRITAITLRDWQKPDPNRWIQVNHPNLERVFHDYDADGQKDRGYYGITQYVDAWEIENYIDPGIFAAAPFRIESPAPGAPRKVYYQREFIYLQLLNQGHRLVATAVADAHSVHGNGVGAWRVFLPSGTDDPAKIEWSEMSRAARDGRGVLSTGPFLTVTANGQPSGSEIKGNGQPVALKIKVQCPDWRDLDRVQIIVNGRQPAELNFTRTSHPGMFADGIVRFDQTISVPLKEDANLIVAVTDTRATLQPWFGTSPQHALKPQAWTNPTYIDINGDGFKANGDTLGYDLPVTGMTVEQAERILQLAH